MSDKPTESTSSTSTTTTSQPEIHNPFAAFTSSSDSTNLFTFNPQSSAATSLSANTETEDNKTEETGDDATVVGADSTAHYEPVVKLNEIETQTGEENDEEVYKQRAALYRFDNSVNEWKERGRGDCKLLKNKASGRIRILLRQDKTLKCCMNHIVVPDIELKPNAGSDRSWTWRCVDYAGDEPEAQTFAIRFKDADTANAFKSKYDEVRKVNKDLLAKEEKKA